MNKILRVMKDMKNAPSKIELTVADYIVKIAAVAVVGLAVVLAFG